jgi:multiple sugar transport system permease protein
MGKAAAISWVLFAVVFAVTVLQTRLQRRWVHYETD